VPKYYAILFLCRLFTLMISQWDIVTDEDPVSINTDDICILLAFYRKRAEHEVSLFLKFWSGGQCVCMYLLAVNFPLLT
jgi:hypothetical protein